jgi:uncharacterized repeat protein (TIGR02543 family)
MTTTLYAVWTKNITLDFAENGGKFSDQDTEEKLLTIGAIYGTLPTPTQQGFVYLEYNPNKNGDGTSYKSGGTVTSPAISTLYAIYSEVMTLSFDLNGGVNNRTTAKKKVNAIKDNNWGSSNTSFGNNITLWDGTNNGTVTVANQTPTAEGLSFKGWYDVPSFAGIDDADANEITPTTAATKSITAYAIYNTTVTFNALKGEKLTTPVAIKVYGDELGELEKPKITGYTFLGWEDKYGNKYTESTILTAAGLILFSKWEENTYTLTFDSEGGTSVLAKTITYGAVYGTLPTITKTGYTFSGWWTAANGGTEVNSTTAMAAANTTIYAHWEINSYKVSFDARGGSGSTARNIQYNAKVGALPVPKKTGYVFDGWFTAMSGGAKITADTRIFSAITYYAHWTKISSNSPSTIVNSPAVSNIVVIVAKASKTVKKGKTVIIKLTKFKNVEVKSIKISKKYKKYLSIKKVKNGVKVKLSKKAKKGKKFKFTVTLKNGKKKTLTIKAK